MLKNLNSNLTPESAAITEIYSALNRNDIETIFKFFAPDIERIEPEGFPSSGTYRGHADVKAHFTRARNTWAEGACEPEQIMVVGDKLVVFVKVKVRLKNQIDWVEGGVADGFIFKNGLVTQMRTFVDRKKALQWAGIVAGL